MDILSTGGTQRSNGPDFSLKPDYPQKRLFLIEGGDVLSNPSPTQDGQSSPVKICLKSNRIRHQRAC